MSNRVIKYSKLPDKTGGLIVTPGYFQALLKTKRDAQG